MNFDSMISNKKKAIFLARKQMDELVCDAVNLEGIPYTLPEIQTLLDGITVGGHKISDQVIVLNQASAWRFLFSSVEKDKFSLGKDYACSLHKIAGKQEALEWGCFRSGGVSISGTEYVPPEPEELDKLWEKMVAKAENIEDAYDKAIFIFLAMSRNQFFYDVNKRMGRFIMNGIILNAGYPVINVPAKRQTEFNSLMLAFYSSGELEPMTEFMKSCLSEAVVKIMSEK